MPEDTRTVLEGVNIRKSAGPDGVHPRLIRILEGVLVVHIIEPFNCTPVDGVLIDWKQAESAL